jgi:hypothetical protein
MATTLKACGRMTRDIETPYEVGQRVVLVEPDKNDHGVRAGDNGVIRRIIISAPNDGDATFPMFFIRVRRGRHARPVTSLFHATEFAPADEGRRVPVGAASGERAATNHRQVVTTGVEQVMILDPRG